MTTAATLDEPQGVSSPAQVAGGRYLRNAWYAASWSQDLADAPQGMVLLEEEIVLYRTADGVPVALGARCPHRFVELCSGKVIGDNIQCPYHGLQFAPTGACAHNPHGPTRPSAARTRSYPTVERHSLIWVWMGDHDQADPALIPDCSVIDDPKRAVVRGVIDFDADYLLYVDNLMDLSHTEYVHTFQTPNSIDRATTSVTVDKNDVVFARNFPEEYAVGPLHSRFVQALGGKEGDIVSMNQQTRWMAPNTLLYEVRDTRDNRSATYHALHIPVPLARGKSRLLWSAIRDFMIEDEDFTRYLGETLERVLANEDIPPMESQQTYLGGRDLMDCKPVLLGIDEAPVRARRILSGMIAKENAPHASA
ncbi:MAG: Vanillate monooxygenase [Bradyrhizobium sp.]|nr:Vanillate monooxygenase [Bradyrhizobium sp.]